MIEVRTHAVAREAYARVAARRDDSKKKEYGVLAHKLPGMILSNGLAQATGFLLAKSRSEPHSNLLNDLNAVLGATGAVGHCDDGAALHQSIIGADLQQTLLLTRRALVASSWIKRYVQGVLRMDATGGSAESNHAARDA